MAVLGENLYPFHRLCFLLCSHFRVPEEEKESKAQDKAYEFRFLVMARGSGVFGISASSRGRGRGGPRGRYRGYFRGRGRGGATARNGPAPVRADDSTQLEDKFENVRQRDEIDEKLGFHRVSDGPKREGWMVNMHPVSCTPFLLPITTDSCPILDTNEVGRLAVGTRWRRLLFYSR